MVELNKTIVLHSFHISIFIYLVEMENNYITYIYMNCLKCSDCDCGMLVQDEVRLIKHDDCLGGVNVMFENNNITTNIIYDIEIDYRCINCDMRTFTKIKNHKGTIQHNLGV